MSGLTPVDCPEAHRAPPTEQGTGHNQDRQATLQENQARTQVLNQEVRHLREEKSRQFLDLMETIDKQRDEMAQSSRTSAVRVGQLQEALSERHSVINALKAKLQMTEAALALSEHKAQELGERLATSEQGQLSQAQRLQKEHRLQRQEAAERESKLLRDLSAANEKNLLLRDQSAWTRRGRDPSRTCRTQKACVSRRWST